MPRCCANLFNLCAIGFGLPEGMPAASNAPCQATRTRRFSGGGRFRGRTAGDQRAEKGAIDSTKHPPIGEYVKKVTEANTDVAAVKCYEPCIAQYSVHCALARYMAVQHSQVVLSVPELVAANVRPMNARGRTWNESGP
jgi:hypothetical protein